MEYDFSKPRRGAVIDSPAESRITIMLDDDVIEIFRARDEAQGAGCQTMIKAALRAAVAADSSRSTSDDKPLTVATLREELHQ